MIRYISTAHPNVKVFITQGGLQSFQEAVHYAVPTIGIPYYWDQSANVAKMVDAKIGVKLLLEELQEFGKVELALKTVLYDERLVQATSTSTYLCSSLYLLPVR